MHIPTAVCLGTRSASFSSLTAFLCLVYVFAFLPDVPKTLLGDTHILLAKLMYSQNLAFLGPRECPLYCPAHLVCLFPFHVVLFVSRLILVGSAGGEIGGAFCLLETLLVDTPFAHSPPFLLSSPPTLQLVSSPELGEGGDAGSWVETQEPQQFSSCLISLSVSCLLASWYFWQ